MQRKDASHSRPSGSHPVPARPAPKSPALKGCAPSDPLWQSVELAQRGRMIVDVSMADLAASEAALGPFHPTTWHFRNAHDEAKRAWNRLRAQIGTATIKAALDEPPITYLTLGENQPREHQVRLITIDGQTYRAQAVPGTPLAPIQWRLTRLLTPLEHGPYFVCRLEDGSTQCDCADWTYNIAEVDPRLHCKHLAALAALGWL